MNHDDLLYAITEALIDLNGLLLREGRGPVKELVISSMLTVGCGPGTTCTVATPAGPVVIRDNQPKSTGGFRFA